MQQAFGHDPELNRNALAIAEILGSRMSEEEIDNDESVESVVQLVLLLAPLRTLEDQLERAAKEDTTTFEVVGSLLKTARIAEVYSLGRIVDDRIEVIRNLRRLREADTDEASLQKLIAQAPWLIDAK